MALVVFLVGLGACSLNTELRSEGDASTAEQQRAEAQRRKTSRDRARRNRNRDNERPET